MSQKAGRLYLSYTVSLLNFFDRSHGLRITAPFNFDFLLLLLLRINIQDRFTTQEDSLVW